MQLVSRIYDGPYPEVDLPLREPLDDGRVYLRIAKGELCEEIPAELAETLDQQGDWLLADETLPEASKPREERVFSVKELKAVAKEAGIEVPSGAKKADIEVLIDEHNRTVNAEGDGVQDPGEPGNQASGDPDASADATTGE